MKIHLSSLRFIVAARCGGHDC